MIIPFHNLATKNKIIIFCFLLYLTYFTLFLNIEVFQFFKYYHIDIIDKVVTLKDENFNKLEFLAAFQLFCN